MLGDAENGDSDRIGPVNECRCTTAIFVSYRVRRFQVPTYSCDSSRGAWAWAQIYVEMIRVESEWSQVWLSVGRYSASCSSRSRYDLAPLPLHDNEERARQKPSYHRLHNFSFKSTTWAKSQTSTDTSEVDASNSVEMASPVIFLYIHHNPFTHTVVVVDNCAARSIKLVRSNLPIKRCLGSVI
jgi:hypothetical protein